MDSPWAAGVLAAGLGMGGVASAQPAPDCRADAPTAFVERFVPADCPPCWAGASPRALPPRAVVLDWITPAGDDAPMAAAALSEAAARAGRVPAGESVVRRADLPARAAARVRIVDGPAWNGYVGLRLVVTRQGPWPGGAHAFAALVEQVPAGNDGTALERHVVRAVAGPLPLDELRERAAVEHLRAIAIPEGSRPDRLAGVAWIETTAGRVLAAAASPARPCR